MINKITLIGYVGKDPESRTFDNGNQVFSFSLATSESYKDQAGEWQEVTQWHNIVKWKNLSDRIKKGSLVYVEGKLTHRKYQDKEGSDRYVSEVVANVVRGLEKSQSSETAFPNPDDAPF